MNYTEQLAENMYDLLSKGKDVEVVREGTCYRQDTCVLFLSTSELCAEYFSQVDSDELVSVVLTGTFKKQLFLDYLKERCIDLAESLANDYNLVTVKES